MSRRYAVDQRVGMIAVVDTTLRPKGTPCLEDAEWVVKSWQGKPVANVCPHCGHATFGHWEVPQDTVREAIEYCNELNAKAEPNPEVRKE